MSISIHNLQIPLSNEEVNSVVESIKNVYEIIDEGDLAVVIKKGENDELSMNILRLNTTFIFTKDTLNETLKNAFEDLQKIEKESSKPKRLSFSDFIVLGIILVAGYLIISGIVSAF